MYEIWKLMRDNGWQIRIRPSVVSTGEFIVTLEDNAGSALMVEYASSPEEALGYLMERELPE